MYIKPTAFPPQISKITQPPRFAKDSHRDFTLTTLSSLRLLTSVIDKPLHCPINTIMGWKQWALIKTVNKTYTTSLRLSFPAKGDAWGYAYRDGDSDRKKISWEDIESQEIKAQGSFAYGHTGKQNEWAGMSADLDIYTKNDDPTKDVKVASIYYSCPWSSVNGGNEFSVKWVKDQWKVDHWGADFSGDALGSVTVEVRQL